MGKLTRIGMDTSKSVFQLHGVDDGEQPALKRKLRRQDLNKFFGSLPRLRVGMEVCGASHHWARELQALGHEVVLIPPQYTKPYVDRGKNDAADAEAICEAISRPNVQRRVRTVEDGRSAGVADADDGTQRAGEAPHAGFERHSRSCGGVRACVASRPSSRRG